MELEKHRVMLLRPQREPRRAHAAQRVHGRDRVQRALEHDTHARRVLVGRHNLSISTVFRASKLTVFKLSQSAALSSEFLSCLHRLNVTRRKKSASGLSLHDAPYRDGAGFIEDDLKFGSNRARATLNMIMELTSNPTVHRS